jgi:23S rRNA (cytosine1962-C5)-methyltransferase
VKVVKQYSQAWVSYELIDAGGGKKIERFGNLTLIRPELQAYFKSEILFTKWAEMADWEFVEDNKKKGYWKNLHAKEDLPTVWEAAYGGLKLKLELTKFKHVGLFPEQNSNWDFISKNLKKGDKFLNLFAYTGAASLVAKKTKADVLHVDSVKQMISWAKENMEKSELTDVKWVLEDALKFAQREVKRGNKYDGIIMDPPAFGLGAKGEKWILEEKIPFLLETASQLLNKRGFLIVNTYSPKLTLKQLENIAKRYFDESEISLTELWMKTKTGKELFYGNVLKVQK